MCLCFWQIIEEIDQVYFKEADFDCSEQELKVSTVLLSASAASLFVNCLADGA